MKGTLRAISLSLPLMPLKSRPILSLSLSLSLVDLASWATVESTRAQKLPRGLHGHSMPQKAYIWLTTHMHLSLLSALCFASPRWREPTVTTHIYHDLLALVHVEENLQEHGIPVFLYATYWELEGWFCLNNPIQSSLEGRASRPRSQLTIIESPARAMELL